MADQKQTRAESEEVLCEICGNNTGLEYDMLDSCDPVCSEACHEEYKRQLGVDPEKAMLLIDQLTRLK